MLRIQQEIEEENVDNENDFEATENIAEPAGDCDWTEDYDEIKYLEHLCNIEAEKAQMMQEATQNFHSRRNLAQKYLESLSLQNNEVLKELTIKAKKSMDSKWRKTKEVEVPSPKKLSDIEEEIETEEASSKVKREKGGLFPGLKVQKSTYQKAIECWEQISKEIEQTADRIAEDYIAGKSIDKSD